VGLDDNHLQYLTDHAISPEVIEAQGIVSRDGEIVFTWRDGETVTEQRRPWPGGSGVYFWEPDKDLHFNLLRDAGPDSPVLIIEGTKQSLAGLTYAPEQYTVLGMAGCWGWSKCKLNRFRDRDVYLCLDADAGSNLDVYEAGEKFAEKLKRYGVRLKFVRIAASGTQGLDDYLAVLDEDERADMLAYELVHAGDKPAEKRPGVRKRKMESDLPDTGGRPGVAVNRDRKEVIDKITEGLKDRHDGRDLFNYGEILTRVKGHETQPLDRDRFHAILADTVACYRYLEATDKRPAIFEPTWPDAQSVGAVMSKAEEFSPLRRVVRTPFLRPDGTVCSTPGYDRETATVLVTRDLDGLEIPEEPTQEQTRLAAKYLMDEWLGDLPFKTEADRANALALVLTPFVRGIVPLAPLGVVSGLQMGVGKNLLADCISLLATGEAAMPLPYVAQEEEMRKQLTAAFSSGAELFVFDEAHVVEGAQLARAVTSLTYGDRVLGVSRIAKFPNQVTWVALGNQVQVNGDMSRRVYFIYLHPAGRNVMDREAGHFRHPDLKLWTAENRTALVTAALTVLRGWYAAGCPAHSRGACMGSFEPWDRMMSGVTAYAGHPAFLTDMRERRSESDFMASYWEAHLSWLRNLFGDLEFTARDVQDAALRDPKGYESPPTMEDPSSKGYTRQLGQAYSKHRDRNYNGLRLVKSGMGHKSTLKWRIDSDNGGKEVTGGDPSSSTHTGEPPSGSDVHGDTCARKEQAGALPSTSLLTSSGSRVLGFDIETADADQLYVGDHEGPFVRLVGVIDGSPGATGPDASGLIDIFNEADVIYGHNILGFDIPALAHHCGADYDALAAKSVDTLTLARLVDPPGAKGQKPWSQRGYYGLDAVAKRLGHTGKSDDLAALAAEFGGYDQIPVDDTRYRDYLLGDLDATKFVYERLTEGGLSDYAKREMRVAAIQHRMTLNGWAVDTELLAERVAGEDAQRRAAVQTLHEGWGLPLEKVSYKLKSKGEWPEDLQGRRVTTMRRYLRLFPGAAVARGVAVEKHEPYASPWATSEGRAALIEAFRYAGAEHYPKTKTGDLALGKDALGSGTWVDHTGSARPGMLNAYGDLPGVVALCGLIAQATGATAKYAEIQRHVTAQGRVHPNVGATQASSRWATTAPALTNLGKRGAAIAQREPLIADLGHVLLTCDLSQVDMRALAGLSQDQEYMKLFETGRDAHMDVAEQIFGARTKEFRNATKAISHGINYGRGAKAVSESTGLDLEMVERFVAARAAAYPRLVEWTAEVRELGESGALLDNGFGRLMRCNPERAHTQPPALMGQGAARDLMCEGLLRLVDAAHQDGGNVMPYLRGVVHDEVIVSVPEDESSYWEEALREAFTFEWRGVPITCEVSQPGRNWRECAES